MVSPLLNPYMRLITKFCRQLITLIFHRHSNSLVSEVKTNSTPPRELPRRRPRGINRNIFYRPKGRDIHPSSGGGLKIWPGIIAVAALIMMVSCAHQPNESDVGWQEVNRAPGRKLDTASSEIQKQLEAEYQQWRGTRHRLGGNSRSGIDCSGFVKAVYKNSFEMDLPRTTKAQATLGRPVKKSELQAGDLVFFKPPSYPRHVGIYLSNTEFMHASKSKGVTISRIDPYYWGKYFWTARRLLTE